jgi:hypothetical protein
MKREPTESFNDSNPNQSRPLSQTFDCSTVKMPLCPGTAVTYNMPQTHGFTQTGSSRTIHLSISQTHPHKMSPSEEAGRPQNSPRCSKSHGCDALIWENIIGRGKPQVLSPFGALYISALEGCHLCSLLFGSLKTFEPPDGFVPLTDNCGCVTDPTTTFFVGGGDNFIQIQVGCKWSGGRRHLATLQVSTKPDNRMYSSITLLSRIRPLVGCNLT